MRQAGRYMAEYRAVRKTHSILEICKTPEIAAEVTITAAEKLDVDAAIIFADLLLPLEVMGMPFRFEAGEGPVIERPLRAPKDIDALATNRASDLGYVAESVSRVVKHFGSKLPVIGFCGAPFTLASYMIEGGGSRNYIHTKKMMYTEPAAWRHTPLSRSPPALTRCRFLIAGSAASAWKIIASTCFPSRLIWCSGSRRLASPSFILAPIPRLFFRR
jgi:uroporphyrinogen decarboxylase